MKLSVKELIIIGIAGTLSFPLIYLIILLVTGHARLEIDKAPGVPEEGVKFERSNTSNRIDSLRALQSQSFLSTQRSRDELESDRRRKEKLEERLKIIRNELGETREKLAEERKKFEKQVESNDSLRQENTKRLSKIYSEMDPEEAANIMSSLQDQLIIDILSTMRDKRQKAEIMGGFSKSRAARISRKMAGS